MERSSMEGKHYSAYMVRKSHESLKFTTVLDVGAGDGAYREWLSDDLPGVTWIAVEAWAAYRRKYRLHEKYHRVIIAHIRTLDPETLPPVDLVIFGDVLEHMTKDQAQTVVKRYLERARLILISIPIKHYPQGIINKNPYEVHVKDDWSHDEVMASFPDICTAFVHVKIGVYLLSRDPDVRSALWHIQESLSKSQESLFQKP